MSVSWNEGVARAGGRRIMTVIGRYGPTRRLAGLGFWSDGGQAGFVHETCADTLLLQTTLFSFF